jgi:hypothetical protein
MKRKDNRFEADGLNPYQGDDVDPFSAARDASGSTNARPTYSSTEGQIDERDRREMAMADMTKNRPSNAKSPVVTKEQMKKAGFDNLRDYLNAQRGLKRRGESSKGPSSQDIDRLEATSEAVRIKDERLAYKQEQDAKAAARKAKEMADQRAADTSSKGIFSNTGYKEFQRIREEGKKRRAAESKTNMRSGGAVKSSASKRADGCATKGKTRGRII